MRQTDERHRVRSGLRTFIEQEVLFGAADGSFGDDTPLISGGVISSFYLVQLAVFVEETFGVHIPDDHLTAERLDTLTDMTDYVLAQLT